MTRGSMVVGLLALAVAGAPPPVHAGVSVNIGIDFPAPPPLVAVPGTPVMYAPVTPANYFFWGGQYWVFTGGAWYASGGYNGPWVIVAPEFVPRPILAVPIRYYHVPPPAWWGWQRERAPHWEPRWGREWHGHGARGHHVAYRDDDRRHHGHRDHHR